MGGLKDLDPNPHTPDEVPGQETEQRIAKVREKGVQEYYQRHTEARGIFLSCIHWTLEGDENAIADRRKTAQEKAIEVFNLDDKVEEPQSTVLDICGQRAFKGVVYQRKRRHTQAKWQEHFENLVTDIEQEELGE